MTTHEPTTRESFTHPQERDTTEETLPPGHRHRVRAIIWLWSGITAAIGSFLIVLSFGLDIRFGWWLDVVRRVGEIVLTIGLVTGLYEGFANSRYLAVIRELFARELRPLRDEVPRLEDGIDRLQKTVEIAGGAIESGITAVYTNRLEALEQVGTLLTRVADGDTIRLVGISLGDFLCPHGFLYGTVRDLMKDDRRKVVLRALIIDHTSDVAHQRAKREEPYHFAAGGVGYETTKCNNELKTATCVAEDYSKTYGERFEYKRYGVAPLCFVIIIGDTMFMEPYHYAGRGGEAPMLRISAQPTNIGTKSRLFQIYENHFEALWSRPSEDVT